MVYAKIKRLIPIITPQSSGPFYLMMTIKLLLYKLFQ